LFTTVVLKLFSPTPRKAFLIAAALTLFLGLFPIRSSSAQTEIQPLEELQLAFWPEYDQPAMLVVYRFSLPADTELPAQVTFRIPAQVGEPSAVAYRDPSNQLLLAEYVRQVDGDWATIAIDMPALSGQLEYYDSIQFEGDLRRFQFDWPGGVASDTVSYEVQMPVGVEELAVLPAAQEEIRGQDGLRYRYAALGPLSGSDELAIDIQYTKPDSLLSVDRSLPEISIDEPAAPATQGQGWRAYLPWILGILGLLLIVAGAGWLLLLNRSEKRAPVKKPNRSSVQKSDTVTSSEIDASPIYCHHCGTQASASDQFCRNCGTKLRI
jgi:hypothetical protein